MGKNYVENSLKRFFKRKVKITLGFVVAFMITGVCAFAGEKADSTTTVGEHNKNYKKALKNLKGLGKQDFSNFEEKQVTIGSVNYKVTADNDYLILTDNSGKEIKIETKYISEKLKTDIVDKLGTTSSTKMENNSILLSTQSGTSNNKESIVNNGIIYVQGKQGQIALNENTVINNGVVISDNSATQLAGKINANLINNGVLVSLISNGQALNHNGGAISTTATNNGIIYAKNGQINLADGENIMINNGILETSWTGQNVGGATNKSYNYGLIDAKKGTGISAGDNAEAFNYGVIKVEEAKNAFNDNQNKGTITNKGIVIADSGTLDSKYDTGILLNSSSYNVVGNDVKVFGADEIIESFGEKNTFGEDITKGFVKDTTVKIDNTEGKVIGAVVTDGSLLDTKVTVKDKNGADKKVGAVLDYAGTNENGLFLKDTTVTGYFEDDGVLLNVGNHKPPLQVVVCSYPKRVWDWLGLKPYNLVCQPHDFPFSY